MKQYDSSAEMDPLLPDDPRGELSWMALDLIRAAERLSAALHPITRNLIADLLRGISGYHSNQIEGYHLRSWDIDAALSKAYAEDTKQRSLQLLLASHLDTQRLMEERLGAMSASEICSIDFLLWIHREFYSRLPAEFLEVEGRPILPGELRRESVTVGRHLPPAPERLESFLQRFSSFYGECVAPTPAGLLAAAAAHHRLAWIHPFLDGNGRVARLFSHAWLMWAGVGGGGLWTISRGFARGKQQYQDALANADERLNDIDGRGSLSSPRLADFCAFFLRNALDQVDFMAGLLDVETLQSRILVYARRREETGTLLPGSHLVLRDAFLRGEIPRGEVGRIVNVSARSGQKIIGQLLKERLLTSLTPKSPLRLGFPSDAAACYFPRLYPAPVSDTECA